MACFLGTLTTCKDFRKSCRAIKPIINQFQIEVPDLRSFIEEFVCRRFLTFDLEPHLPRRDTNRKASADSLLIFLLYSHPFLLEERLFIGRCHPGNYVVGGSVLKKNYLTSMRAAVFKVLLTNNKV